MSIHPNSPPAQAAAHDVEVLHQNGELAYSPPSMDPLVTTIEAAVNNEDWNEAKCIAHIAHSVNGVVLKAYEVGLWLYFAKVNVPHGDFGTWCEEKVPFLSAGTRKRYMRVARYFLAHPKKLEQAQGLTLTKVLEEISRPEDAQPALLTVEAVDDAAPAEHGRYDEVTESFVKVAKERDELLHDLGSKDKRVRDLEKEVDSLKIENSNLHRKPAATPAELAEAVDQAYETVRLAMKELGRKLDDAGRFIVNSPAGDTECAELLRDCHVYAEGLHIWTEHALLKFHDLAGDRPVPDGLLQNLERRSDQLPDRVQIPADRKVLGFAPEVFATTPEGRADPRQKVKR